MSQGSAKPPAANAFTWQDLELASRHCEELAERMCLLKAWARHENAPARLPFTLHRMAVDYANANRVVHALQMTLLLASADQPPPALGGRISHSWHELVLDLVWVFLSNICRELDREGYTNLSVDDYLELGESFPVDAASKRWPLVRDMARSLLPHFDSHEVRVRIRREYALAIREMKRGADVQPPERVIWIPHSPMPPKQGQQLPAAAVSAPGGTAAELPAETPARNGARPGRKRGTVNQRMMEHLNRDPTSCHWTQRQWAAFLKCKPSAIAKAAAWQTAKAARALAVVDRLERKTKRSPKTKR